jgi:D-sedoheptulose 7-phosphate isomerase
MIDMLFLDEVKWSLGELRASELDRMVQELVTLRERGGRLFLLGVGGGAAHASHAAADFRTLAGIEAYCVSDNAANITALTNDEGWHASYSQWLVASRLDENDAAMFISVGGGHALLKVSMNLVESCDLAWQRGATVLSIVGRDGGYVKPKSTVCVLIPVREPEWVTGITEAAQAVVLHMLISDKRLQVKQPKWEAVTREPK